MLPCTSHTHPNALSRAHTTHMLHFTPQTLTIALLSIALLPHRDSHSTSRVHITDSVRLPVVAGRFLAIAMGAARDIGFVWHVRSNAVPTVSVLLSGSHAVNSACVARAIGRVLSYTLYTCTAAPFRFFCNIFACQWSKIEYIYAPWYQYE